VPDRGDAVPDGEDLRDELVLRIRAFALVVPMACTSSSLVMCQLRKGMGHPMREQAKKDSKNSLPLYSSSAQRSFGSSPSDFRALARRNTRAFRSV
jgi:hypothetical protein